jgi:hypothetical protein
MLLISVQHDAAPGMRCCTLSGTPCTTKISGPIDLGDVDFALLHRQIEIVKTCKVIGFCYGQYRSNSESQMSRTLLTETR